MAEQMSRRSTQLALALASLLLIVVARGSRAEAQSGIKQSPNRPETIAPYIRELSIDESILLPGPVPTSVTNDIKCDAKGNIFVMQSNMSVAALMAGGVIRVPVTKLSLDAKSTTDYPTPVITNYKDVNPSYFNITPDGNLYQLVEAREVSRSGQLHYIVIKFSSEGQQDSYVRLADLPTGPFTPSRLASFQDGHFLVSGLTGQPGDASRRVVTTIFDRIGRFAAYVDFPDTSESARSVRPTLKLSQKKQTGGLAAPAVSEIEQDPAMQMTGTVMLSGADGYVYLLTNAGRPRVYAISSSGQVVHDFEIPVPAPGLTATSMSMTGDNMIAMVFSVVQGTVTKEDPADPNGPQILTSIVSPTDGEVRAVYRLPASEGSFDLPACAPSSSSFLHIGTTEDGQHEQITRYVAR